MCRPFQLRISRIWYSDCTHMPSIIECFEYRITRPELDIATWYQLQQSAPASISSSAQTTVSIEDCSCADTHLDTCQDHVQIERLEHRPDLEIHAGDNSPLAQVESAGKGRFNGDLVVEAIGHVDAVRRPRSGSVEVEDTRDVA